MQLTTPQLERIVTEVMVELLRPVAKQPTPRVSNRYSLWWPGSGGCGACCCHRRAGGDGGHARGTSTWSEADHGPPVRRIDAVGQGLRAEARDRDRSRNAGTKTTREAVRWQLLVSKAGSSVLAAAEEWTKECGWRTRQLVGAAREAAAKAISVIGAAEAAGVIVVTDRPDEACLLANRNDKVRAVVVHTVRGMQTSVELVGPNVFVVDPTGRGLFELKQLLVQIVKTGKPVSKLGV